MALAYDGKSLPGRVDIQYTDNQTFKERPMNPRVVKDMAASHLKKGQFSRDFVDPNDAGDSLIGQFVDQLDYQYQDKHGQTIHETLDHWLRYNLIPAAITGVDPAYVFMFLVYKALRTHDQQLLIDVNNVAGLNLVGQQEGSDQKKQPSAASEHHDNQADTSQKNDSDYQSENQVEDQVGSNSAQADTVSPDDLFNDPEYAQPLSMADMSADLPFSNPSDTNPSSDTEVGSDDGMSPSERPAESGRGTVRDEAPEKTDRETDQDLDQKSGQEFDREDNLERISGDSSGDRTEKATENDFSNDQIPFGQSTPDWGGMSSEEQDKQNNMQDSGLIDRGSSSISDSQADLLINQPPERAADDELEEEQVQQAAEEFHEDDIDHGEVYDADNLGQEHEKVNDQFDLSSSLVEQPTLSFVDGLVNYRYHLQETSESKTRASLSAIVIDFMKQVLVHEVNNAKVSSLIEGLAAGDVATSYCLYMAAKTEQISRVVYERFCMAYGLYNLGRKYTMILQQATSFGEVLNNNELPVKVRWFLYMNRHAPQAKKDLLNSVFNRLNEINDKLDLHTALQAAELSVMSPTEEDRDDALFSDYTKQTLNEIDQSYNDLIAPIKTRRRTRQVRRRNNRK